MSNEEKLVSFLVDTLGYDKEKQAKKIKDTLANKKITKKLLEIADELSSYDKEKVKAADVFIFDLATRLVPEAEVHRTKILEWIMEDKVRAPQLDAIITYTKKNRSNASLLELEKIEKECGVGIITTTEEVIKIIDNLLKSKEAELKEARYTMVASLHAELRKLLKWADRAVVTKELNDAMVRFIGPKGENETQKKVNKKKKDEGREYKFPDPKENVQVTTEILEKHLKETGGKIITRFPPEPNGYLHIGHAKAMNLNFTFANQNNGICLLRFDDTNPDAENQEYIDSIIEMVEWMGNKPHKITHASDYMEELFDFGVQLIKLGKAYICHQKPEDYKSENNPEAKTSPWRDRPMEESLKLFEDMRNGKFKEGEAVLRMKMDMESPNPCMWDQVAFRIKYHPHPRTGDKYCVYPTYDFTHCINDSLENITHSLCTLEFVIRRESYYWLVDALGLYRSFVWEYGRLYLTHTLLSKRRLIGLVDGGYVDGWDDPRMPTLVGFRRRGYTPSAITNFCEEIGVKRSDNVVVDYGRLENCLRSDLEKVARRAMAVMDPIKVNISGYKTSFVERPNIPKNKEAGTNTVPVTSSVYIERGDFKEEDVKGFFGLALKTANNEPKWVRLKYGPIISIIDAVRNENGEVVELNAQYTIDESVSPKGTIHWVAMKEDGSEPDTAEIRWYSHLFNTPHVFKLKGSEWEKDINPDSKKVIKAYIDPTLVDVNHFDKFQFERVGYFCVDPDSKPGNIVFNLSTTLKESKDLKKVRK